MVPTPEPTSTPVPIVTPYCYFNGADTRTHTNAGSHGYANTRTNTCGIGTTVEAGGSSYTLNEVKDPAPAGIFGVDAGKRLVALDITQVGIDETNSYNVHQFEGYVYGPGFQTPTLTLQVLAFGQIVHGLSSKCRQRDWCRCF